MSKVKSNTDDHNEKEDFTVADLTRTIDFSGKQISSLPKDISKYPNLEKIVLKNNGFSAIPSYMFEISQLVSCNIAHNLLTDITHAKFENWVQLEQLNISFNAISAIPSNISFLGGLKKLDCRNNWIKQLPNEFCKLKSLQILHLSHNLLEELPGEFSNLLNLKQIYLENNRLNSFPNYPEDLTDFSLQIISIRNNPIKFPDQTLQRLEGFGVSVNTGVVNQTKPSFIDNSIQRATTYAGPTTKSSKTNGAIPTTSSTKVVKVKKANKNTIKTRTRSESLSYSPQIGRRARQRDSLRLFGTNLISLSSESIVTPTEMDIFPSILKNSSPINFVVENESATVASATKEQLIGLLTYDSGIGMKRNNFKQQIKLTYTFFYNIDMVKFQKLFLCTYPVFLESTEFLVSLIDRFDTSKKLVGKTR